MSSLTFEYDFAISYAGEQRKEAHELATILQSADVRVFFDEFQRDNLLGKDAGEYLADIYLKRARFCIIFASRAYGAKVWPIHERRNAVARAIASKTEYILPIKFDDTEIPGVPPTVIYIRWSDAEAVARILLSKLAGTDGASVASSWSGESISYDSLPGADLTSTGRFSSYNVLVLGKAGVGKSSLINYLFGRAICVVGVGRSQTALGFHKKKTMIRGAPVTIFDSGGLDIASLNKWKQLLDKELEARDSAAPPEKWFHTVLYCINAGGDRFDSFETDLIRNLASKKQRVVIVFCKADQISRATLDKLRDAVMTEVGERLACVPVCSQEWEMANGQRIERFGLDDLLSEIVANFWDSIRTRLPLRCISLLIQAVDDWGAEQKSWIGANIGYFNKSVGVEHLNGKFESFIYQLSREILPTKVTDEVRRTINMFGAISRMFGLTLSDDTSNLAVQFQDIKKIGSDDLMGAFGEIFINVVMFPIPLPALFRGSFNRSELESSVDRLVTELKTRIQQLDSEISVLIEHLVVPRR